MRFFAASRQSYYGLRYPAFVTPAIRSFCSSRISPFSLPIINISNGTFYRKYPSLNEAPTENPPLFPQLIWSLPSGCDETQQPSQRQRQQQHWAVIGSSGRTEFLNILRGQNICLPANARSYPYLSSDEIAAKDFRLRNPSRAIRYVGFAGDQKAGAGGLRGAYLSARYESLREETDFTVLQYLKGQLELNPSEDSLTKIAAFAKTNFLDQVIRNLRLRELLHMPLANLSNGEMRRAKIAKALLDQPEVLLLDEVFMGLDPPTIATLSPLLRELAYAQRPRLVLSLRPQDYVPDWITHLLILGPNNTVALQGEKGHVNETLDIWKSVAAPTDIDKSQLVVRESLPPCARDKYDHAVNLKEQGQFTATMNMLYDMGLMKKHTKPVSKTSEAHGEPVIEIDGLQLAYGDKNVLGDWVGQDVNGETRRGLTWRVNRGERWGVFGLNGSGKTTLVSLITSDHPQAYSLPVRLFGRSRLPEPGKPAISIFDLQKKIGHSSPEVHAFFPGNLSARQALATAFADTFLSRPKLTAEQDRDITTFLLFFEADLNPNYDPARPSTTAAWADAIPFTSLDTGRQRLILLLRALVHKPDIIVLDEAFGGMAPSLRDKCLHFLEVGESLEPSTGSRRTLDHARVWNLPARNIGDGGDDVPRFTGVSKEQSLIVISHVREEIPDIVSQWMLLPSPSADAVGKDISRNEKGELVLRQGSLGPNETIADDAWDDIWGGLH